MMGYYITAYSRINIFGKNPKELAEISLLNPSWINCMEEYRFYDREILKQFYRLDRSCQYLLESVRQVMEQVGSYPPDTRVGVVVGASVGPVNVQKRFYKSCSSYYGASSVLFKMTPNNIYSGIIALLHDFHHYNVTLYTHSTASLDVINLSVNLLKTKTVDVVLAACVETESDGLASGSAAVLLEACECRHLNREVCQGSQQHLFTDEEISRYFGECENKYNFEAVFCDAETQFALRKTVDRKDRRIFSVEQGTIRFGAVCGMLQIVTAIHTKNKTSLLVNRYGNQFTCSVLINNDME